MHRIFSLEEQFPLLRASVACPSLGEPDHFLGRNMWHANNKVMMTCIFPSVYFPFTCPYSPTKTSVSGPVSRRPNRQSSPSIDRVTCPLYTRFVEMTRKSYPFYSTPSNGAPNFFDFVAAEPRPRQAINSTKIEGKMNAEYEVYVHETYGCVYMHRLYMGHVLCIHSMQMMHVCGKINDMETLSYLLATTRGGFKLFLWLRAWLTHLSYLLASTNNEIDREEKNCRNSQELKVIGKKRFWGK